MADHQPGLSKAAPEYEDCKRIAEQSGSPVKDILDEAMVTFRRTQGRQKRAT
ncbi:MAG: hypothetical protein MRJ92_03480 [Nitrospira sp.]|nr:hypothetical protein [Nitrospira sp.]